MKRTCNLLLFIAISHVVSSPVSMTETSGEPYQCMQEVTISDYANANGLEISQVACPNGHFCDEPNIRDLYGYDSTNSITYIKLFFTIVREDDSTNPAITPQILDQQMQQLNDDFLPYGIQYEYNWRYYESSYFRVFSAPSYFSCDSMRQVMYVSPETQYNVIATHLINPGNSWTTNPTLFDPMGYRSGSIMSTNPLGAQFTGDLSRHVFSHELGHVFGLIHTYWGYNELASCINMCAENLATGSSDFAGDRCSDTPPERWWSGETFAGAGLDSCSGLAWPIYPNKNHMNISIYGANKLFSPQQVSRIYCYMEDYWQHIIAGVRMSADTTFGKAPFTVNFSGWSDKNVNSWFWDFGDGDTSVVQNPQHQFDTPGVYTIETNINSNEGEYTQIKNSYILVHDDTVKTIELTSSPGDTVLLPISMTNFIPVTKMTIPVTFTGIMALTVLDVSTEGTRAETSTSTIVNYDSFNKRYTFILETPFGEPVNPDTGIVAYMKIIVPSGPPDSLSVSVSPYSSYDVLNEYYDNVYTPVTSGSYLIRSGCCENIRGNIDGDALDQVDISDLVYYVDYSFGSPQGPAPSCYEEADVDNNGSLDIADIVYLVSYMFSGGPVPMSCF